MVHVPDPAATFRQLAAAMEPGGLLFFNVDAQRSSLEQTGGGFLYTHAWPVLREVRAAGFRRRKRLQFIHCYQRLDETTLPAWYRPIRTPLVRTLDRMRYNAAVSAVGDIVRDTRATFAAGWPLAAAKRAYSTLHHHRASERWGQTRNYGV